MNGPPAERLPTWERTARGELEQLLKEHLDRADGLELMLARALLQAAGEARDTWVKLFSKMVGELPRDLDTGFDVTGTPKDPRLARMLGELRKAYSEKLLRAGQAVEEIADRALALGEELTVAVSKLGEGEDG